MATKPEATFRSGVHKYLPLSVHHEAVGSNYSKGTPDQWYDGCHYDLWIEWKYAKEIPKHLNLLNTTVPKLSEHQQNWLKRAHGNGRNVCVIVGFKEGGIILSDMAWESSLPREVVSEMIMSRRDLAKYITEYTTTI